MPYSKGQFLIQQNTVPTDRKRTESCKLPVLFYLQALLFVTTNAMIQFVDMLRYAQLDIFAFRQIRYNLPFGRFRYDINPWFA